MNIVIKNYLYLYFYVMKISDNLSELNDYYKVHHTYIYIYIYIYIYDGLFLSLSLSIYIYIYMHTHTYTNICVYIYIYIYILFSPVKPDSGIIPPGQ